MNDLPEFEDEDDIEYVSKSEMKRDMLALQNLAIELTKLPAAQLAELPLTDELLEALQETRNIKKKEALRRHHQFLGRVMRKADHEAISERLEAQKSRADQLVRLIPVMEKWRDDLIAGDKTVLGAFIEQFPDSDRQRLRQLVKNAQTESSTGKLGPAARKLFLLIREEVERHS